MKVAVIGSTRYVNRMIDHVLELGGEGIDASTPKFDGPMLNELEVAKSNLNLIKESDEVHVFWDGQSNGVIFDLGMCFALGKPITMVYENYRTFSNLFRQMENANASADRTDTDRAETKEECR